MIGYHCGVRLVPRTSNLHYFSRQCLSCGQVFRQRKRQRTVKYRLPKLPQGTYTVKVKKVITKKGSIEVHCELIV